MSIHDISAAFIGCGKTARFHADVLGYLGVSITAVCGSGPSSRNASLFAESYSVPHIFPDWRALLSETRSDAIWVVTPWNETGDLLTEIAIDGRPALVEKPLATTSKRIWDVIDLLEKGSGRQFNIVCGMNRRHYDFIPQLKTALAQEQLRCIAVTIAEQTRYRKDDIAKIRGLWLHSAIHEIDLLYYLLGEMRVKNTYREFNEELGYLASLNALLESVDWGIPIFLMANWDSSERKSILIETSEKTIKISPIETMTISEGLERTNPTSSNTIARFVPNQLLYAETSSDFKPGFLNQARSFLEAVDQGDLAKYSYLSMHDAYIVTRLIEDLTQLS